MFNISEFFSRIRSIQAKGELLKSVVQKAIENCTKTTIESKNILIKAPTITLNNIPQALRNEIFVKRETILKEINETQQTYKFTSLR